MFDTPNQRSLISDQTLFEMLDPKFFALTLKHISMHFTIQRGIFRSRNILTALEQVDLQLEKGKTLGLVGESGCGKSTLARIAAGLLKPNQGELYFKNISFWSLSRREQKQIRGQVQMVFQDPYSALNPRKNIEESLREPLDIKSSFWSGIIKKQSSQTTQSEKSGHSTQLTQSTQPEQYLSLAERRDKVIEYLSLVGLGTDALNRYPHEFSGGQRQRLVVARALIAEPNILICDEPVSALDVSVQAQVLNLLKDLQDKFKLSYLFISHDLGVIGNVSDKIAVMYLGSIIEYGNSGSIFNNPLHPYTKALMDSIPGTKSFNQQNFLKGDPPNPLNKPKGCAFHPRCPKKMSICTESCPKLLTKKPRHFVACHLYN